MISSLLSQHRKKLMFLGAFALVALLLFVPDIAHAAETDPLASETMRKIQELFNVGLQWLSALFWPVLYLSGGLFDNDLIFGGQMGETLLKIWVQMRNFVNIAFVLILLVIAIYNVLGLGEQGPLQQLQLKQVLPKFVIALIVVNFSFLGIRVFLDFTNVVTTAVFALPTNVVEARQNYEGTLTEMQGRICNSKDMPFHKYFCNDVANKFNERGENFFGRVDGKNIAFVMAMHFGKLADQKFVGEKVADVTDLIFNMLFGIVMYVIYAVSFISLFLVLLARLAFMWVAVALSPLMAVGIVLPELKQIGGGQFNIGDKFIQHAIAPLIIGLFLSIGYIMTDAFNTDRTVASGYFATVPVELVDPHAIVSGITDLQDLLIAIVIAVVVWMGVGAAAEGTLAKTLTDKIRGWTTDFGQWAAKLPMYAQFIPVAKGVDVSPMQMLSTLKDMQNRTERERGGSLAKEVGDPAIEALNRVGNKPEDMAEVLRTNPQLFKDPVRLQQKLRAGNDSMQSVANKISGSASYDENIKAVMNMPGNDFVELLKKDQSGGAVSADTLIAGAADKELQPTKFDPLGAVRQKIDASQSAAAAIAERNDSIRQAFTEGKPELVDGLDAGVVNSNTATFNAIPDDVRKTIKFTDTSKGALDSNAIRSRILQIHGFTSQKDNVSAITTATQSANINLTQEEWTAVYGSLGDAPKRDTVIKQFFAGKGVAAARS